MLLLERLIYVVQFHVLRKKPNQLKVRNIRENEKKWIWERENLKK